MRITCPVCRNDPSLNRLSARVVSDDADALVMGEIRNACRDGYSFDRAEITPEAQIAWWAQSKASIYAWLFTVDEVVGYGLLRPLDTRLTTSVGILPQHRGHHYGRAIMRFMVHQAEAPVWSTAPLDNPAAIRLHDSDHWMQTASPEPGRLVAFLTWERK